MVAGLLAGAGVGPAGAAPAPFVDAKGALTDLAPTAKNPTDGATAEVWTIAGTTRSTFVIYISGLDPAAAGTSFGAHVHIGSCVPGNGNAALGHYNSGGVPSDDTEVWLDFKILSGGYALSSTTVPFVIDAGAAKSVVIHAEPTQDGGATPGAAGARIACLPDPL